ncbi:hypothetical protein OU995_01375 [Roseateles sp. SL47]|uniref:hypothetical protein n=1 Tax=Roseateles sp. SL47 TaxID=2995138 RepID=UPI00226F2505|nr:hypothetical protein [Roseateles sp. SL47]WAC73432.1 hypothetical protein OU995_01375 [Roseateles sp. SL47]
MIASLLAPETWAQDAPLFRQALRFDQTGAVFDEVIKVPRRRGPYLDLKLNFSDDVPNRHERQLQQATPAWNRDPQLWRGVTLFSVTGLRDGNPTKRKISSSIELYEHSHKFKLLGLPIRLRVLVTPLEPRDRVSYVPGQWAYVWTDPRNLVQKVASFAFEEVDLSRVQPETSGRSSRNKYLLQFQSMHPGHSYRIQIFNLAAIQLPDGISAVLILQEPEISK